MITKFPISFVSRYYFNKKIKKIYFPAIVVTFRPSLPRHHEEFLHFYSQFKRVLKIFKQPEKSTIYTKISLWKIWKQ